MSENLSTLASCSIPRESIKMIKRSLTIDSWIREAQEASMLVEDIEIKVKNKNCQQEEEDRLIDRARSKLLEVGIKLDRLDSLLHNPPSKSILTEEDLEYRWEMLLDFKLRTRALAVSLYALPSPNRPGGSPTLDNKETDRISNMYDVDQMKDFSREKPELLKPLISEDATSSQVQIKQCSSFVLKNFLRMVCWIICVFLGAALLMFILVVLCAVL